MKPKRSADAARRRGAGVKKTPARLLELLYAKQRGECALCLGILGLSRREWHVDHKRPIAQGGRHEFSNLQLTHARCNLKKGARFAR